MKYDQRQRLVNILSIQAESGRTASIRSYLKAALKEAGMTVVSRDRMLFARKGDPDIKVPVYVAHSDTVHRIVPEENYRVGYYMDKGELVYHAFDPRDKGEKWRGVGGDDKCGLWVALEAAFALENVGVVITRDEEVGCKGARRVSGDDLAHASVLIQADRRGNSDAVWKTWAGEISGKNWQDHVNQVVKDYGYNWCQFGAGTDVSAMHETGAANVSAINLSAGYYLPHSDKEYVHEGDVEQCMEMAIQLGLQSGEAGWDHKLVKPAHKTSYTRPGSYTGYESKSLGAAWTQKRIENGFVRLTHAIERGAGGRANWGGWDATRQMWVNAQTMNIHVYLGPNVLRYTFDEVASIEVFEPFVDHMSVLRESFYAPRSSCAVESCHSTPVVLDCMSGLWLCSRHEKMFFVDEPVPSSKQREYSYRTRNDPPVSETPEARVTVVRAPIDTKAPLDGEFRVIA